MKTPIILRIFKGGQLLEVRQFDLEQIIVGHEADVHVDLNDPEISPIHAIIELRDSGYYISDLGSQSGTLKNGKPVLDEPISSGDQLGFGPFTVHFFVGVPKPKAPPTVTVPGATPVQPAALDATTEKKVEANPNEGLASNPQAWNQPQAPAPAAPPVQEKEENEDTVTAIPMPAMVKEAPRAPEPVRTQAPQPPVPGAQAGMMSVGGGNVPPPRLPDHGSTSVGIKHGSKTYAPKSEIKDLREYLKPTKGPVIEVLTSWRERILQTHHYVGSKVITLGPTNKADVFVPAPYTNQVVSFLELSPARVFVPDSVTVEVINSQGRSDANELQRQGKGTRQANGLAVRLDQGDLVCLTFGDGGYQVFVRFVAAAPLPIMSSPLDLSAGELTAMIASIILVILFSVYVSTLTPAEQPKEEEALRMAEFVYNKAATPTPTPTPAPQPTPEPPKATPPPPKPTPTPPPKVVKVADKPVTTAVKKAESVKATAEKPATRAAEVRPKPSTNQAKTMTSTKQGGAVKMGNTAGANAQSQKDVTKTGLLSAFGGGGVKSKLDQAYSGSGELLGMADKASGTSGQNENRAGEGIGSRFKDSGAGGKGTATEGIAGVGTQGRGGGTSAYGSVGMGGKGSVSIEPGGAEEAFEGSIDREAVRRVIRSILNSIKSCYERRLRANSNLEGKVVIRFVIEEQGRVRTASTKSSTLNDREVESCVAMRIKDQRFPEPPAGTVAEVDYPFVFGQQK